MTSTTCREDKARTEVPEECCENGGLSAFDDDRWDTFMRRSPVLVRFYRSTTETGMKTKPSSQIENPLSMRRIIVMHIASIGHRFWQKPPFTWSHWESAARLMHKKFSRAQLLAYTGNLPACTSSCSWVLICTKGMFCLVTASAVAPASRKSFLLDFRDSAHLGVVNAIGGVVCVVHEKHTVESFATIATIR
jgi:hypothetical protein